jgi:predicted  nucleic acid-binding Zn-ribbon protein
LTRAAKGESQLRRAIKKHQKDLADMKSDVKGRQQELKGLQGELAAVKKSRKTATAKLQKADAATIAHTATAT